MPLDSYSTRAVEDHYCNLKQKESKTAGCNIENYIHSTITNCQLQVSKVAST